MSLVGELVGRAESYGVFVAFCGKAHPEKHRDNQRALNAWRKRNASALAKIESHARQREELMRKKSLAEGTAPLKLEQVIEQMKSTLQGQLEQLDAATRAKLCADLSSSLDGHDQRWNTEVTALLAQADQLYEKL
jgi:hypothetical protein